MERRKHGDRVSPLSELCDLVNAHELLKSVSISLVGTENQMSPAARRLLSSDLAHRYYLTDNTIWEYPQGELLGQIEQLCKKSLCRVFRAKYANVRPISGINGMTCLLASFVKPGQQILSLSPFDGGHGATAVIARRLGLKVMDLPFDRVNLDIDFIKLERLLKLKRVDFIYLDFSNILFMPDIRTLMKLCAGRTQLFFDCSQVLGLMVGTDFPTPLEMGLPIMGGSVHKSFPGPQKGVFLTNSRGMADQLEVATNSFVSNHHLSSVAALAATSIEMEIYGQGYSRQLRQNALALGRAMAHADIPVHTTQRGMTGTHQIWIDTSLIGIDASAAARRLKDANIVVNCARLPIVQKGQKGLRLGVSEITRLGMKAGEMKNIAQIFADCLYERHSQKNLISQVKELRSQFLQVKYCFYE